MVKTILDLDLCCKTFPKFRVWLKKLFVTIKRILQNPKMHMKKVKKRYNIQKSTSRSMSRSMSKIYVNILQHLGRISSRKLHPSGHPQ